MTGPSRRRAIGAPPTANELADTFAEFRPRVFDVALDDFSGLHQGATPWCGVRPGTTAELSRTIERASESGTAVRLRGGGHSMSGSSLPRAGELLISTEDLCALRFERPGTVQVGAGALVWTVRAITERFGGAVPVVNHGYPAPTVGGYIAAGGFGDGSGHEGGFWNHVRSATLVDGRGRVHHLDRDAPSFAMLFGSVGQLGCIAEAELVVRGLEGGRYPLGLVIPRDEVRLADRWSWNATLRREARQRLVWFTLFVAEGEVAGARAALAELERRFAGELALRDRYEYPIAEGALVAPLIHPRAGPFAAIGAWGVPRGSADERLRTTRSFERAFRTVAAHAGYGRYVQSEYTGDLSSYRLALGERLTDLAAAKRMFDPDSAINRGSVFAARSPACAHHHTGPV